MTTSLNTGAVGLDLSPSARTSAAKVASGAAVLFAVSFFLTVASINVPHTTSNAKLLDWWQRSGNVYSGIISEFFAIATAVLFVVVINYFRALTRSSDSVQWSAFARSLGAAFVSTMLVSAALRGVIGQLVKVQDEPLPGVDVLRYSTALNYTMIGTISMLALSLAILAMSVVIARSGVLARWFAYVGFGCGAIMLVASLALVGQFTIPVAIVWSVSFAVAVWRQPVSA